MGDKKGLSREEGLNGLLKTLEHEFLASDDGITNHWSVLSEETGRFKNGVSSMREDYHTDYEMYHEMMQSLLDETSEWENEGR